MNVLNRIVVIVLILAAMIVIPLGLMFPEQAEYALRYGADVVAANLKWLNSLDQTAQIGVRLLLAAVGMVIFFVGLLFLALEVIRLRRSTVRLRDGSGSLMMDGVSENLAYHIDLLPDVLRVRPKVRSKGKSVRVSLYVETAPGVSVLEKSNEIRAVAHEVIEEQLGLQVDGEVSVVLKPAALPKVRPSDKRPPKKAEPQLEEPPLATLPPVEPLPEVPPRVVPPTVEPPRTAFQSFEREPEPAAFPPPLESVEPEGSESEIIEVKSPKEPGESEH
ncbi:MAG: hypothetical protein H8D77_00825 [Chloroflexi bacterium]|nr:hypothetical protein [Chloroflexota bacterium]MBL7201064.1 hypothetical protein [Anaerolineae bacterium]